MSEEETLKNLYRQVNQAMVDKDIETLERILKPNILLVHMTGYQQPVKEWLEQIETEEMKYYSWEEDAIKEVQIEGYRASLIGQSRVKARIWGSGPSTWRLQIEMHFEKVDGQWQIIKQVTSTY
ncbi:TPA: nuclear transport factor 2 family protein [Streptococcus suis]